MDERSVQAVLTPFNIFKNQENVASMLNESFNQFKFDSKHFQQAFNIFFGFKNVERPGLNVPDIWLNNCIERMLKKMLKPFKRSFSINIIKISYDKESQIFLDNVYTVYDRTESVIVI